MKKLIVLSLLFVSSSVFAWYALIAPVGTGIMWLGRVAASNVAAARAVEWSIYAHGAVLGILAWKNSNDSTTPTTTPVSARMVVDPKPDAQRKNPDTNSWNNAAAGSRDPTPKTSYSPPGLKTPSDVTAAGGGWPGVLSLMGGWSGSGSMVVYNSSTNQTTYYQQTTDSTTLYQGQSCSNAFYGSPTGDAAGGSPLANGGYSKGNNSYGCATLYSRTVTGTPSTSSVNCGAGYALSNGSCVLQNAAAVTKPAGKLPCEVMRNSDGSWDIDTKNPECTSVTAALTASGKTATYTRGVGDYDSVTTNDDGGLTISTRSPSGNRDIVTDAYSSSLGGYSIRTITDLGSGSTGSGSASSPSGSGTGGGNCGSAGLPACAVTVDDSGFTGKDASVVSSAASATAALDGRIASVDKTKFEGDFGVTGSWLNNLFKPGNPVACSALNWQTQITHGPLAGFNHTESVDLCDKTEVLRQYYSWVWYVATVWAIAMLFFGTNGNARTR